MNFPKFSFSNNFLSPIQKIIFQNFGIHLIHLIMSKYQYSDTRKISNEDDSQKILEWCRYKLGKTEEEIKDFSSFQDGVFLYNLVEILVNHELPKIRKPSSFYPKLSVINKALKYLNPLVDEVSLIDGQKIAKGDIKEIKQLFFYITFFGPIEEEERKQFGLRSKIKSRMSSHTNNAKKTYNQLPKSCKVVGIDFGNKVCRYTLYDAKKEIQSKEIESVVCFKGDQKFIGEIPKDFENDDDLIIIKAVKQILGQMYDAKLQNYANDMSCPIEKDEKTGRPIFSIYYNSETKNYSPEEIASMIFQKVRKSISEEIGENVVDAVISVPSSFIQTQKQSIKDAAKIAGFEVKHFINNSMAAVLSYNIENREEKKRNIAVIDMGSTETDISIYELNGDCCTTKGKNLYLPFGAHDMDLKLADYTFDVIENEKKVNIRNNSKDRCKVIDACENARIDLVSNYSTNISIKNLSFGDFEHSLTQDKFNDICDSLFQEISDTLESSLNENEISNNELSNVLLVGKPAKMPQLRKKVINKIESGKVIDLETDDVVKGAAINGEVLNDNDSPKLIGIILRDTTPVSFGIASHDPTNKEEVFKINSVIIPKGSPIPTSKTKRYTTVITGQESIHFQVIQGENHYAKDCVIIGDFTIENIERAKVGIPQIDVSIQINNDAMLEVKAHDVKTNAEMSIKIQNNINLTMEEIEQKMGKIEINDE